MRLSLIAAVSTLAVSALSIPTTNPAAAIYGIQEKRELTIQEYRCGTISFTLDYINKVKDEVCNIISGNPYKTFPEGYPKLLTGDLDHVNLQTSGNGPLSVYPLDTNYKTSKSEWDSLQSKSYILIKTQSSGCELADVFREYKQAQWVHKIRECFPGSCLGISDIRRESCQLRTARKENFNSLLEAIQGVRAETQTLRLNLDRLSY